MSQEEILNQLLGKMGAVEANINNMSSMISNNRQALSDRLTVMENTMAQLKEDRAAVRGGYWTATAILGGVAAVGAGASTVFNKLFN